MKVEIEEGYLIIVYPKIEKGGLLKISLEEKIKYVEMLSTTQIEVGTESYFVSVGYHPDTEFFSVHFICEGVHLSASKGEWSIKSHVRDETIISGSGDHMLNFGKRWFDHLLEEYYKRGKKIG